MENKPLLELYVHLASGVTHRFIQNDQNLADQILQQIHPKMFHQDVVSVYSENLLTAYPGKSLEGVSVVMNPLPGALLALLPVSDLDIVDCREITGADYNLKRLQWDPTTQPFTMLVAVEMASGHRFWAEEEAAGVDPTVTMRRPSFERHIVHTIFSRPPLVCRRLGGGLSLWNRSQMASCALSPRPAAPNPSFPADFVSI